MRLVVPDEIPIKTLIGQGVDDEDVKKLEDGGIYTCNRLIHLTKKYLTGVTGLSEANVDKIREAAEKKMEQASAQTGGSSKPKFSIARIIAQVEKDMLKLTLGVQSDTELEFVAKATSYLATAASQFLACKKATFPARSIPTAISAGAALAVTSALIDSGGQTTRVDNGREYYPYTVEKRAGAGAGADS